MELFDRQKIAFVSVTQQFNTANSMGRLMLNVLLSFAQFEREIISERTRDKIAATHRKGKWTGGMPVLGYDVQQPGSHLVVNECEALQVRQIFDLYLKHGSLLKVVAELATRGWRNKQWTTRKSTCRGGKEFSKTSLHKLLTNPTYLGKVKYKQELHEGQHDGIVCPEVLTDIRVRAAEANVGPVNTTAVEEALRDFNPVWEALSPREQEQVLKLLVQRVDYDGRTGQDRTGQDRTGQDRTGQDRAGQIAITFQPDGFDSFLTQFSGREVAAFATQTRRTYSTIPVTIRNIPGWLRSPMER